MIFSVNDFVVIVILSVVSNIVDLLSLYIYTATGGNTIIIIAILLYYVLQQ